MAKRNSANGSMAKNVKAKAKSQARSQASESKSE